MQVFGQEEQLYLEKIKIISLSWLSQTYLEMSLVQHFKVIIKKNIRVLYWNLFDILMIVYCTIIQIQILSFLLTPNGIELAYHLNIKGAKPMILNEDITNDLLREQRRNNPFFNGDFIELKDGAIFHIFESGFPGYRFGIYSNAKQRTFCCDGFRYSPFFCFLMRRKLVMVIIR